MKANDVNVITVDWSKGNGYILKKNFLFYLSPYHKQTKFAKKMKKTLISTKGI